MKNKNKALMGAIGAAITIVSIYLFAPWQFVAYYFYPLPSSLQKQTQEAIEQGLDGIIVYVDKKGQPAEHYANGWHNRAKKLSADPNAFFKIGSIRKLYEASAVAMLAAKGDLSLDQTLADHLPSLVGQIEYAKQVTIRMLVQHKSGIKNYTDQEAFSWDKPLTSEAALALILNTTADFKPGSDYRYSNSNYLLLRMIMDKVLGYDHQLFIKNNILLPLDLNQTYFSVSEIDLEKLMSGYYVGYDTDFKELKQGYVATARDVAIFLRALNEGTMFNQQEQEIYSRLYKYDHTGWVLGHASIARYYKEMDTVVIQFTNTTGNDTVLLNKIIYNRTIDLLKLRSSKKD